MNDDKSDRAPQALHPPGTHAAPSLWTALAALGTAICAGVAAFEAFHMRPALGWALAAGGFMLVGFLAQNASTVSTQTSTQFQPDIPSPKWWAWAMLVFMLLLAGVLMLLVNMFMGIALLLMAVVFHTYGGFGVAEELRGNTRIRIIGFVVAWSLTLIFSVLSQFIYPAFTDLFSAFGPSLPPVTRFVTDEHAMLLLLPVIVCALWAFWPAKVARLRIAMWFGWFSILLMLMALGSMYLPLIEMGSVVDAG